MPPTTSPRCSSTGPIGLEGIDQRLIDDMSSQGHARVGDRRCCPTATAGCWWSSAARRPRRPTSGLASAWSACARTTMRPSMKLFDDEAEEQRLWEVREAGLGATAYVPGRARPLAGLGGRRGSARAARRVPARLPGAARAATTTGPPSTATSATAASTAGSTSTCARPAGLRNWRSFLDEAADLVVSLRRLALGRARRRPAARRAAAEDVRGGARRGVPAR